jgi:hypothetical protein
MAVHCMWTSCSGYYLKSGLNSVTAEVLFLAPTLFRIYTSYFILYIQPLKMELIEGSETLANHNRTPGKYPKEYIQVILVYMS